MKILHTVIWAFFCGCILAIPAAAMARWWSLVAALTAVVLLECLVLALNRCRCPLTGVAAQYTDERSPNFDIYLPRWLAGNNKSIFGILFVLGELFALWNWLH